MRRQPPIAHALAAALATATLFAAPGASATPVDAPALPTDAQIAELLASLEQAREAQPTTSAQPQESRTPPAPSRRSSRRPPSYAPQRGEPVVRAPLVLDQHGTEAIAGERNLFSRDRKETASARGETASSQVDFELSNRKARALAQLTGDLQAPILKAEARDGAAARAFGYQGYTFQGDAATELVFNFRLTGDLEINSAPSDPGRTTNLWTEVGLFEAHGFDSSIDFATLRFEVARPFDGAISGAFRSLHARESGPVDMAESIRFNVDPGDQFYIWSGLYANANEGDVSDGYHTLVTSITAVDGSTPEGLVSASFLAGQVDLGDGDNGGVDFIDDGMDTATAVSTPVTLALLVPGLMLMSLRRKLS